MEYIEVSAKTVEEAITNAQIKLGVTSDSLEYIVVDKGSAGFLGIGKKPAVIKARVKSKEEAPVVGAELNKPEKEEKKAVEKKEQPKKEIKKEVKAEVKDEYKKEVKTEAKKELKKAAEEERKTEKKESVAVTLSHEEIERRITTFLDSMFGAMGLDVKLNITFDDKESSVNVDLSGDNMGALIGKRGQTLDSVQYLTSLVVNKGKEKYVRVKVDTEDYRKRRKETLESLARNIAYKVKRTRRSFSLEPMNPYERRIIHSALQNDKFVSTRSEGEEPFRHVVIYLDREKSDNNRRDNRK